jgi:hypothetical protein
MASQREFEMRNAARNGVWRRPAGEWDRRHWRFWLSRLMCH